MSNRCDIIKQYQRELFVRDLWCMCIRLNMLNLHLYEVLVAYVLYVGCSFVKFAKNWILLQNYFVPLHRAWTGAPVWRAELMALRVPALLHSLEQSVRHVRTTPIPRLVFKIAFALTHMKYQTLCQGIWLFSIFQFYLVHRALVIMVVRVSTSSAVASRALARQVSQAPSVRQVWRHHIKVRSVE